MGVIIQTALAWLVGAIVANSRTIVGQILVALGISVVTGATMKTGIDAAIAQFQSALPYYSMLNSVGIIDFVNIIASAVIARSAITAARIHMTKT